MENWNIEHANVAPSDYLKISISAYQQTLLSPTVKNVLVGHILYDVKGKGTQQKISIHRLDCVDGNTNP